MSNSTWSIFPPTENSHLIDVLPPNSEEREKHISRLASRHLYSHCVQILSQNESTSEQIRNFLINTDDLEFVLLCNVPLYALVDYNFVNAFVKHGVLHGVSVNRDVNTEDTVAILPSQILLCSLNLDTYYKLGIIGKPSILNRRKNLTEKYRIEIELNKAYFVPEKKNYQRTYECLKRSQLKCDMVLKWKPESKDISPSSLTSYFKQLQRESTDSQITAMTIHQCVPTLNSMLNRSVPIISCAEQTLSLDDVNSFIDWCSALVAEVQLNSSDDELSTFKLDDSRIGSIGKMHCLEIKGFFTGSDITLLHQSLCSSIDAMIVHGFEDSPQCWSGRNHEHYKNLSGENLYGVGHFYGHTITWCLTDQYDFGIEKL